MRIIWELSSENYQCELSSENYEWELSPSISSRRKVEIYRDTGVSKNAQIFIYLMFVIAFLKMIKANNIKKKEVLFAYGNWTYPAFCKSKL